VAALLLATLPGVAAGVPAGTVLRDDPRGSWTWPLQPQPRVLAPFEPPPDPYGSGHRGVDLAGAVAQPVVAVAPGRVRFAGQVAGRGIVVVDHGRLRSTYEPVLVAVRRGDRVGRGELVGTLTLAGGHCLPLPCLHLGARDGETYVDPLGLLGDGRVRLLPLQGLRVPRPTVPGLAVPGLAVPAVLRPWWTGLPPVPW